ncbi:MAG: hypothetical protein HY606_11220 [Planctomycetes bacterium]|nr:hypothetical protein [Planctomycetota bacterium]
MENDKKDKIISILEDISSREHTDYSNVIRFAIIEGIDSAVNGHRGTLDGVDMDRLREERRRDDFFQSQIDHLTKQSAESKKQTTQIKRQVWWIIAAFFITFIASIATTYFAYLNYKVTEKSIELSK